LIFSRSRTSESISAREAAERGDLRIVDVRSHQEWRGGHIAGAKHIPLDQLPSHLDELKGLPAVGFICHSGARSKVATKLARRAGVQALNIDGGMLAWKRAGLPSKGS
jgi:rhodanese-related sulfurtransferase